MRPPAELYDEVEFLTQGGMARVYRARRKTSNRLVAVREIPGGADGDQRIASERHGAEIQRALSAVDRRVPTVYDVSTAENGWLYVEMELVDGEDLADRIQRGPLDVNDAVRIAREIFDFLRVAHGQAVVVDGERREHQLHGDLTPRNVRIGSDGTVRILDFGIAKGLKATATAQAFANYGYISPERARTGRMGLADDYWSAGVLLYEMLAGTRAFPGTPEEIRGALASHRPPIPLGPHVPRPLRLIVSKLLAWDVAFRYPTADAVLEDLSRFQDGRKTQAEIEEEDGRTRPVGVATAPLQPRTEPRPARPAGREAAGGAPTAAVSSEPQTVPLTTPRREAQPRRRNVPWLRAVAGVAVLVIAFHENAIFREADARARIAATESVPPDRLWTEFRTLQDRAWLNMTTRGYGRIVAERLSAGAIATLKDYREDVPTLRKGHFEEARALLARAARVDLDNRAIAGWLRLAEGHLARIEGEARDEEDRRPALLLAVSRFEDAARLAPNLPDPHIGLARIYTYFIPDPNRARRAISAAEQLGQPPGLRGRAQLGDLSKSEGDAYLRQARLLTGLSSEEPTLVRARTELAAAIEEYAQARGFGQSVRSARQAAASIRGIDLRLEEIRPAARPEPPAPSEEERDREEADEKAEAW